MNIREQLAAVRREQTEVRTRIAAMRGQSDMDEVLWNSLIDRSNVLKSQEEAILGRMADGGDNGGGRVDAGAVGIEATVAQVLQDPETQERLRRMAHSSGTFPVGQIDLGQIATAEDMVHAIGADAWTPRMQAAAGDVTIGDGSSAGRVAGSRGVVLPMRRPLRLLDLVPTGTMDAGSFEYVQETSLDTYAAAEVAELAAKPGDVAEFTDAEAKAETIAHWLKVKRQALDDQAALQSALANRLMYGVLRRLEAQIINGNGTSPNIRGLLNTTGIGDLPFESGVSAVDHTLSGLTTIRLAGGMPNGVLVHPTDWEGMISSKATDGHYFSDAAPFQAQIENLWGVPAVVTPACPIGHTIPGDWAQGAQVLVREGVNVRVSDSDQDDFVKNRVTLLGEGRFAFVVWQPTAFADVEIVDPEA